MNGRGSWLGVPEAFELNAACVLINKALGSFGCYQVGSSLQKRDYRDVDVRYIMDDERFCAMFNEKMPDLVCEKDATHERKQDSHFCDCGGRMKIKQHYFRFECNPLWSLMCISISHWLRLRTGLPIDFQIQPQSFANDKFGNHEHPRNALGMFTRSHLEE